MSRTDFSFCFQNQLSVGTDGKWQEDKAPEQNWKQIQRKHKKAYYLL